MQPKKEGGVSATPASPRPAAALSARDTQTRSSGAHGSFTNKNHPHWREYSQIDMNRLLGKRSAGAIIQFNSRSLHREAVDGNTVGLNKSKMSGSRHPGMVQGIKNILVLHREFSVA